MTYLESERYKFWQSRAGLGISAGSNDVNLKKLEMEALDQYLPKSRYILDAGCGNGYTIVKLAQRRRNTIIQGFDYSETMVEESKRLIKKENLENRVKVFQADLMSSNIKELQKEALDCIYTQRSLINLNTYSEQLKSIKYLWKSIKKGGSLVLCESFNDGLKEINDMRTRAELPQIEKPWHNNYLNLSCLEEMSNELGSKHEVKEFSGSYYFVSRIINAWQAQAKKEEPSYKDPVNLMSMTLPPMPICGQSKIVIFKK